MAEYHVIHCAPTYVVVGVNCGTRVLLLISLTVRTGCLPLGLG